MIALFSLSIPLGSGSSYTISSQLSYLFSNWQWSLRITPCLGLLFTLLLVFLFKEPTTTTTTLSNNNDKNFPKKIFNRIFILLTFGYVCIQFSINTILTWFPIYQLESDLNQKLAKEMSNIFGLLLALAGCLAFCFCYFLAFRLKRLLHTCFDSLISASCCLIAVPVIVISILEANLTLSQILIWTDICISLAVLFIANIMSSHTLMIMLCSNKQKRLTILFAFYLAIGLLIGDLSSFYAISSIKSVTNSLKLVLYSIPIMSLLGSIAYFIVSLYLYYLE